MASTIAKMSISFGLVSIPVKLTAAARTERISFNQLSPCCHARVRQHTRCEACEAAVTRDQALRGYEYEKGKYVTLEAAEIEALEPTSAKVIEITAAVEAREIDPILFDASYYLEPEPSGKAGYALLTAALSRQKKAAVAKVTMHGAEHVVIIRPYGGGLMFHTMFYQDEVRQAPAVDTTKVDAAQLKVACQLLDTVAAPFDHTQYADEYRAGVQALINAKVAKQPVPITTKAAAASTQPTADLLALLTASIKAKTKPAKTA